MSEAKWLTILSRYASRCGECGRRHPRGTIAEWRRGQGVRCPGRLPQGAPTPMSAPRIEIRLPLEGEPSFRLIAASQAERDRLSDWICASDHRAAFVVHAASICNCWPREFGYDGDDEGEPS